MLIVHAVENIHNCFNVKLCGWCTVEVCVSCLQPYIRNPSINLKKICKIQIMSLLFVCMYKCTESGSLDLIKFNFVFKQMDLEMDLQHLAVGILAVEILVVATLLLLIFSMSPIFGVVWLVVLECAKNKKSKYCSKLSLTKI